MFIKKMMYEKRKRMREVMQKLYEAAMKYPDEKLAKAIGDVSRWGEKTA